MNTEFPPTPGVIYLDAAATGPLPTRTINALAEFNARRAQPWTLSAEELTSTLEKSRTLCAKLIGAKPSEIALMPNTSSGLHAAARSLPVMPGKIALGLEGEFPANVYPWMSLERTQDVPYLRIAMRDGLPDYEALLEWISRGDVGMVVLSWVSFLSGDRANLARIGAECRKRDIWFVVDAIQGIGTMPFNVRDYHIDFISCGAQKWLLSPWGSGFTYVRKELIPQLEPGTGGWLSMRWSDDPERLLDYKCVYYDDARRFEVATIAYQDCVGMNASLELILEVGLDTIERKIYKLTTRLMDGIAEMPHLTLLTPRARERRAGIVSCTAKKLSPVTQRLDAAGIRYSVRAGVLRFSPHFYNTTGDIDAALEALHR
ncbi:MAG TPA: aminotransferase class V-fold PLP-dependent enzyme [Gemmatimonadaceae bacterium]|nr:aminotransferase class V-fold PLP-dependent enzyme [Gemmatimonadaceae bacterium]